MKENLVIRTQDTVEAWQTVTCRRVQAGGVTELAGITGQTGRAVGHAHQGLIGTHRARLGLSAVLRAVETCGAFAAVTCTYWVSFL